MTLSAELLARVTAKQTGANDFGGPKFEPVMEQRIALTDGTDANQADILFADQRTVASGANDDIDLAGALADAYGATIDAAEIVAIFLINAPRSGAANTTALTIGGGSNPFVGFLGGTTPTVGPIQPGNFVMIGGGHASGLGAVAGGSADVLRVSNASGAAATYQIMIFARSA